MAWWWLSFVDPDLPEGTRSLGVSLVQGDDLVEACKEAHRLGINPGGEVLGCELPDHEVPGETYRNRLMPPAEARALTGALH